MKATPHKNFTLEAVLIPELPADLHADDIKVLLNDYKQRIERKQGLLVVRGPFGSIQPRSNSTKTVDLIIRALVIPKPTARKRGKRVSSE